MNEERWRQLRRAEAGGVASDNPEQQIRALTDDIQRFQRIVKQGGLSAEARRLLRKSAEQRLDEATALRHGQAYTPTAPDRGQREVRTFACKFQVNET